MHVMSKFAYLRTLSIKRYMYIIHHANQSPQHMGGDFFGGFHWKIPAFSGRGLLPRLGRTWRGSIFVALLWSCDLDANFLLKKNTGPWNILKSEDQRIHQEVVKGLWYVPGVGWGNFLETWMPSSTFAKSLSFIYYLIWNLNRKYQHKHSQPASHCWLGKKVANTPPNHTIPTEIFDFSKLFF